MAIFFSLTLMALGGAFFLPNIWKLLNSNVYNSARDRLNSFIVSYSALAVAGLIATSGAGYIADKYGYEFTFLIGGVLNLLSLCIFLLRSHIYKSEVNVAHNFKGGIIAIIFGFIVTYFLMNSPKLSQVIIIAIAIGLLFYFYTFYKMAISDKQRKSILQYFVCCMYSVVFWTVATLAQTSVTIFTQNNLDRYIFGFEFPSGSVIAFWYGSMILAIFVISVFIRNKDIIKNLVLGLITTTLACMTIFSAVYIRGIYNHVPFISIVIFYLFLGFGEVFVQPTGNAAAGEFMPENRRGIALGIWQFSGGLGVALSGYLANLTVNDNLSRLSDSNLIYSKIYMEIGVTCLALTLILYVVSRNLQAKI
ncbi:MFS transporter [Piscirickettsia salmonis]|uniref:POT-type proton-dependent oligopeptide transporter n=1 Tax=Piscirickettsia salmonis TaxID=1238 RepID=UPI00143E0D3A|nr:MFS transporter [Piscirickettsia salmonis]QIX57172.1 peptide MFS transporter [Piscirickettsia salmonis]